MAYDAPESFEQRYGIAMYGPATDGDLNFDGINPVFIAGSTYTPVMGVYYLSTYVLAGTITVGAGVEIRTRGNIIRCWKLIGDATSVISDNGNDAAGGTAGAALSGTLIPNSRSSGAGGAGRATIGNGAAGGSVSSALGGAGGSGGDAGAFTGAAGGSATAPVYSIVGPLGSYGPLAIRLLNPNIPLAGGGGGGGGALGTAAGPSGGGGGGGGCVYVNAATWEFEGTLRAKGGAGGNAAATAGGGGGGGGGGCVFAVYRQRLKAPQYDVSGGAGGLGFGGGLDGAAGSSGTVHFLQGP